MPAFPRSYPVDDILLSSDTGASNVVLVKGQHKWLASSTNSVPFFDSFRREIYTHTTFIYPGGYSELKINVSIEKKRSEQGSVKLNLGRRMATKL